MTNKKPCLSCTIMKHFTNSPTIRNISWKFAESEHSILYYTFNGYILDIMTHSRIINYFFEKKRLTDRKINYLYQENKAREIKNDISNVISGEKERILKTVSTIKENYML